MPSIPIDTGGGGGGIGGIPTRYLVIGGGAIVAAFFFMQRGKSAAPASQPGDVATGGVYGSALGPNAALALGDLQNRLMQESGTLQQQIAQSTGGLGKQVSDTLTGLSSRIDVAASTLGDQGTAQQRQLFQYLMDLDVNDQNYATTLYQYLGGQIGRTGEQLQNDIAQLNAGGAGLPPAYQTPVVVPA
jgi:hypothetical protein